MWVIGWQWAYNNRFYIGTIISLRSGDEQIEVVDFLSKRKVILQVA